MTDERDSTPDSSKPPARPGAGAPEEAGYDEDDLAALNAQIARDDRVETTLESKSFTKLAWERFKRNKQAVAGSLVVLLLVFVGIFSPLLANSLPYVIETTRPKLYETTFSVIYYDGSAEVEALEDSDADKLALPKDIRENLSENYKRMRAQIAQKRRAQLDDWWGRFKAAALGSEIEDLDVALDLLEEFDEGFNPDYFEGDPQDQYALQTYYPAFRALNWNEVAFMATFLAMVLSFPLRGFLFGGPRGWLIFGVAVWAGVGSWWHFTQPSVLDTANYKEMRDNGWAARYHFPPVPYSENENLTDQVKEAPFWAISPSGEMGKMFSAIEDIREAAAKTAAGAGAPAGEVDATEFKNRLKSDIYLVRTAQELRDKVTPEQFGEAVEALGLASFERASWKRVADKSKRRDALLEGKVETEAGEFDAKARLVMQRGNWKLAGFEAGGFALGEFGEIATSNDLHWLGTDGNGRDLLSRMIYSTRIAMSIGVVAVSIYCFIGIVLGALAGYFGGALDLMLSRVIEIVICFPVLFLLLIVVSFAGSSELFRSIDKIYIIMIVIGLIQWTDIARLVRGEFLRLTNEEFVQAIRAVGGSHKRVMFKHLLPNALGPVLVAASFGIASAILYESSLSFIGLGVTPPTASWGTLLHQAREDLQGMWWMTLFPGTAIFIAVTCFNLLGEGARDALDPKAIEKH